MNSIEYDKRLDELFIEMYRTVSFFESEFVYGGGRAFSTTHYQLEFNFALDMDTNYWFEKTGMIPCNGRPININWKGK